MFAPVRAAITPAVDDVVAQVVVAAAGREARRAILVMSDEIVVIGAVLAAPNHTKAMRFGALIGAGFADHCPLNRYVFTVVDRQHFVPTPTGGDVIDNDVLVVAGAHGIP